MHPLGAYQPANPSGDRLIIVRPLMPSADPRIKGGPAALSPSELADYFVCDGPSLLAARRRLSVLPECDRLRSVKPTDHASLQVAARWIVSFLRVLCPTLLEDQKRSQIDPYHDPLFPSPHEEQGSCSH